MKAFAAIPSAATALPALNPYHPTQSMPVPIMREHEAVRIERALSVALALADHEAKHEGRPARRHVDDRTAGEVDRPDTRVRVPDAVHQPVDAPDHVGEREVDDEHPRDEEGHERRVLHPLRDRADDERRRDDREHELVHREDAVRDPRPVVGVRRSADAAEQREPEATQVGGPRVERQAVTHQPPEHGHEARAAEALRHDREHVLASDEATVEEREPRERHEEDERRRRHHPGVVTGPRGDERPGRAIGDVGLEVGHAGRQVRRGPRGRRRRLRPPGGRNGERHHDGHKGQEARQAPPSGQVAMRSFDFSVMGHGSHPMPDRCHFGEPSRPSLSCISDGAVQNWTPPRRASHLFMNR